MQKPFDGENNYTTAGDHARHHRRMAGIRTLEEIDRIRRFYREFDYWLESLRIQR